MDPSRRSRIIFPLVAMAALVSGACSHANVPGSAPAPTSMAKADPRVGLHAGLTNAGEAVSNLRVVSKTPSAAASSSASPTPTSPSPATTPSRATTTASRSGTSRTRPTRSSRRRTICPASQSDVSVYKNLLFVSGEANTGRLDCGGQGVPEPVSKERLRGIRIFDITDIREPEVHRQRADLPRLAHAHGAGGPAATRTTSTSTSRARPACARRDELPGCVGRHAGPGSQLGADSGSRSSRCRSRIREQAAIVNCAAHLQRPHGAAEPRRRTRRHRRDQATPRAPRRLHRRHHAGRRWCCRRSSRSRCSTAS